MPVIASIHLGKSGGTAFANLLTQQVSWRMPVLIFYGLEHGLTGIWNNGVRTSIKPEGTSLPGICAFSLRELKSETCVVHGHITASEYLEFLPRNSQFFTWLRHPLQRICSHYYYWKNHRLEPRQRPEAKPLFDSVVSGACSLIDFGRHPLIAEYCSRMLEPLSLDELALAAVVEHAQESLTRLSTLLELELPSEMRVLNPTRGKPAKSYALKPEEESQLLASNAKDMELYRRALSRLLDRSKPSPI